MAIARIFGCAALILTAWCETGLTQEPAPKREGGVEIAPFDNLSGQPDDNWIGAGIAHTLAADLAPTRGEGHWLVRGAYQRVGDQIWITADLVQLDDGLVLTSVKEDGVLADLFALQDRLAARVRAAIRGVGHRDPSDDVAAAGDASSNGLATTGLDGVAAGAPDDEAVNAPARGIIDGPPPPMAPAVVARDQSGRVTMRAIRLDEPLRLDGQLDEPVYETIAAVTDFIQQEPNEGAPATEQTEVWVLFDRETVYVSARCWDSRVYPDFPTHVC